MTLYKVLYGENSKADKLLDILGLTRNDFGRYRDVYLADGGDSIVVYTRLGGNCLAFFKELMEDLARHEYFGGFSADEFDKTYVYVRFQVPAANITYTRLLAQSQGEPLTVKQKTEISDREFARMSPKQLKADKRFAPLVRIQKLIAKSTTKKHAMFDDDMPEDLIPPEGLEVHLI